MADKKRFLDKDYTRRQFLKLSGKSLAGLALSTSMLSAMGVTEKAVAEDKVRVWAFPQGLLVETSRRLPAEAANIIGRDQVLRRNGQLLRELINCLTNLGE